MIKDSVIIGKIYFEQGVLYLRCETYPKWQHGLKYSFPLLSVKTSISHGKLV